MVEYVIWSNAGALWSNGDQIFIDCSKTCNKHTNFWMKDKKLLLFENKKSYKVIFLKKIKRCNQLHLNGPAVALILQFSNGKAFALKMLRSLGKVDSFALELIHRFCAIVKFSEGKLSSTRHLIFSGELPYILTFNMWKL